MRPPGSAGQKALRPPGPSRHDLVEVMDRVVSAARRILLASQSASSTCPRTPARPLGRSSDRLDGPAARVGRWIVDPSSFRRSREAPTVVASSACVWTLRCEHLRACPVKSRGCGVEGSSEVSGRAQAGGGAFAPPCSSIVMIRVGCSSASAVRGGRRARRGDASRQVAAGDQPLVVLPRPRARAARRIRAGRPLG